MRICAGADARWWSAPSVEKPIRDTAARSHSPVRADATQNCEIGRFSRMGSVLATCDEHMRTQLSLCALLAASLIGCATDSNMEEGDDTAPPWYEGVSTLTGASQAGNVDGPRGTARLNNPVNVAYGPDGKLYVADFDNDLLRVVDVETGDTSTVIKQANFKRPFGLAFGKDGTLYVSTDNDATGDGHSLMSGTIWRVNPAAKTATMVVEKIGRPRGLTVLTDGRIAIGDYMHHVVQVLNPSTLELTVLAGTWDAKGMADATGADARFSTPYHLVQRADGKLLVADYDNHRLRIVGLDGVVTTFTGGGAGFADGAMTDAKFNHPQGMAQAANGDIYVSDLGNYRIRKIVGNAVETVVGNGTGGFEDSDDKLSAEIYGLEGISLKPDGSRLYLADGGRGELVPYNRIRVVSN